MNISFTEKQAQYIAKQVESGDYQNASEVVRDALRMHEFYRNQLFEQLKADIQKGWTAPDSNRSVQDIIQSKRQAR